MGFKNGFLVQLVADDIQLTFLAYRRGQKKPRFRKGGGSEKKKIFLSSVSLLSFLTRTNDLKESCLSLVVSGSFFLSSVCAHRVSRGFGICVSLTFLRSRGL